MIRMRPTASESVRSVAPKSSVSSSYIDSTTTRTGTGVGPISVEGGVTAFRAGMACSRLTPGRNRATTGVPEPRRLIIAPENCLACHTAVSL
jgi:hypothetical protein